LVDFGLGESDGIGGPERLGNEIDFITESTTLDFIFSWFSGFFNHITEKIVPPKRLPEITKETAPRIPKIFFMTL
tara:strand:+ start:171 stop:395 length:225 start_codon:yes stop_codon:yes gene_type:complete